MIGSPATVESENFTVRRMTVWKTVSPQASTSRSITSRPCRVRPSYIVPSTPSTFSLGFSRSLTLSIVVLSSATPRSAKYSHSSGTMTPSEAVSALTVSRPSEGWQSIRITSYCVDRRREHPLQGLLAADLVDQLHLGGREVDVGGQQVHARAPARHDDVVEGRRRAASAGCRS